MNANLAASLQEIKHLIEDLHDTKVESDGDFERVRSLSNRLRRIHGSLQSILLSPNPIQLERDRTICLAALILCRQIMLQILPPSNIPPLTISETSTLADELQMSIVTAQDRRMHSAQMPLLLWVLYIGGSGTSGATRKWFCKSASMEGGYAVGSWGNVKGILREYIWTDILEEEYHRFWTDCQKESKGQTRC